MIRDMIAKSAFNRLPEPDSHLLPLLAHVAFDKHDKPITKA